MAGNSNIRSYRDLIIWQRTKTCVVSIYKATENFPPSELYGLTAQMRRAAISMPSNIAEGFRRKSQKDKLQFIRIAYSSGAELETQLEISRDLGYLNEKDFNNLAGKLDEIMKMINKTINALET
jgi:four helix bundle protein